MKHFLLLIVFLNFFYFQSHSQGCVVSWVGAKGANISTDSATNLPHAVEGNPYEATIQFKILADTTYLGFHATVDWVQITGVTGFSSIPSSNSFVYVPYPAKGQFAGGQTASLEISGTPALESSGVYPITVYMTVYFHLASGKQGSLNMSQSLNSYRIVVDQDENTPNISSSGFDMAQNYPNPFKSKTSISFNLPSGLPADFTVSNLVGNIVYKRTIDGKQGVNTIVFDASGIEPGVYFYSIQSGPTVLTKRLIIDRN